MLRKITSDGSHSKEYQRKDVPHLIGVIAFDPMWIFIFLSGQDWSNTAYSDPA
jgi:hypothetical protein